MNWKGYGKKCYGLTEGCPGICLSGLGKTMKNLRIVDALTRDFNQAPSKHKSEASAA
jgi:hypothetical protein